MFENEVAADNRMREYDKLSHSAAGKTVSNLGDALSVVAGVSGLPIIGGIAKALGLAELIRQLGIPTVEENLDFLGAATEDAISRVEQKLHAQGESIEEIRKRLDSPEFKAGLAAAVLQTQRTNQKARLKRMALVLANGLAADDFEAEKIDDMMRAAVELIDADIRLLEEIYTMLSPFMRTQHWIDKPINEKWNILSAYWQKYWDENKSRYSGLSGMKLMGSFARLESMGMIAPGPNRSSTSSPVAQCYFLLPDGARFFEWIQEIALQ
ncbi:MAG TPA: hypothetical protein VFU55_08445 [Terracidiphilus sp.]|nr:hypothetical protein [Terracidiphilus sp.]